MRINMMIGNRGTTLSCATPVTAAGQGIGLLRSKEVALSAGKPAHIRQLANRGRAFGVVVVPTAADMPTYQQPKIHVPHSPLRRSP